MTNLLLIFALCVQMTVSGSVTISGAASSPTTAATTGTIDGQGDSIMAGAGLTAGQDWLSRLALGPFVVGHYTVTNHALSGRKVADLCVAADGSNCVLDTTGAAAIQTHCAAGTATNPAWYIVSLGINDMYYYGTGTTDLSATNTYARLHALWALAKSFGCKVAAVTVQTDGNSAFTAGAETQRAALNASIRGAYGTGAYDVILDLENVSITNCDAQLYQSDALFVHPTAFLAARVGAAANNIMQAGGSVEPIGAASSPSPRCT